MVLAPKVKMTELRDGFSAFLSMASRYHPITPEEEQTLAHLFRETRSQEAAQQLVLANIRYVVKVALEYRRYGCDLNELVQAGNLGLAEAVQRFDPDRGTRLVTYASWWIRDAIRQHVARSRSVSARGTTRAERKLLGSPAGPQRDLSLDNVHPSSLPMDRDPEMDVMQHQEMARLKEAVAGALQILTTRERHIAKHRLLADQPRSLSDIGEEFGVSRERARQLAERTKSKLKAHLEASGFSAADLDCVD